MFARLKLGELAAQRMHDCRKGSTISDPLGCQPALVLLHAHARRGLRLPHRSRRWRRLGGRTKAALSEGSVDSGTSCHSSVWVFM